MGDQSKMKAAIYKRYGPPEVLQLTEVEKPSPRKNEILVKIHAATVTSGDVRLRASDFPAFVWLIARCIFGLFRPWKQILGHEVAGLVEAVGSDVTNFKVGEEVFGTTTMLKGGSYAEYICLPQQWSTGVVAQKPSNIDFQQAAALPIGSMTAMSLFEKAKLGSNQNVLIYGASGSVGSYAIQLAVDKGNQVTAVCSGKNAGMVQDLGSKHVIDYNTTNYYDIKDKKFDIVFDAVGKSSKSEAKKVLKEGGTFVSVEMLTEEKTSYLLEIQKMAEMGKLKPYIDKSYPLDDIVDAHAYVDSGRKRGNVSIVIVP